MQELKTKAKAKFIATRLREARDARGIPTLTSMASLVGVDTSAVSRWEAGLSEPSADKVLELARALNVRPSYFFRPHFQHGNAPAFLRSLASARKRDLARQRARLRWLQEISQVVQHYVSLPPVDLPPHLQAVDYRTLRDEDIEGIASDLRAHWKLGNQPIGNVIEVVERAGFVVGRDEMGTTALDGLCNWSVLDGRPYLLLAEDKMSFFRRQMDTAHEMAHALLHRHVSEAQLREDFDLIEAQAFRLASAFLMPADSFALAARTPTLNGLLMLKDRWRVSVKAMIRRCRDLNLIVNDEATQLYKYYSAKGWNREEPMDRSVPLFQPKLLAKALTLIVDSRTRSKADLLASDFTVPGHDVATLIGLDSDWFSTGEVIQLAPTGARQPASTTSAGEIVEIDFAGHRRRPGN
ncbi:helix-turn-helix domain-containing protein [Pseudoroseomonas ludipueritiae]|uniref:ImmA/IrrE family metallo-endopeptidase n=1 Tax=Pseudoroseomonas ludipueritiae TaxID=198093 RepID=A0ABR7R829_9PROT|nr:XRE family transcriptional regulator [Pseudoroseomonas ludipueritiae]MBC9177838.1 ImmA/IrrE family metallo-endopeptidase [Pseudoroseomonas ludipueritiae]MCG7363180.1 XRE family transcriptional regulator [Roseomonas sp. ACRSG]